MQAGCPGAHAMHVCWVNAPGFVRMACMRGDFAHEQGPCGSPRGRIKSTPSDNIQEVFLSPPGPLGSNFGTEHANNNEYAMFDGWGGRWGDHKIYNHPGVRYYLRGTFLAKLATKYHDTCAWTPNIIWKYGYLSCASCAGATWGYWGTVLVCCEL